MFGLHERARREKSRATLSEQKQCQKLQRLFVRGLSPFLNEKEPKRLPFKLPTHGIVHTTVRG